MLGLDSIPAKRTHKITHYHRTTAQSLVFWIEEEGLGWDRMAVTLFSQCDRKLLNS